jgi:hypothetical protein
MLCGLTLVTGPLRAEPMRIESAKGEHAATARKKFDQGKKLYTAGKLEQAIGAFRESHDAVADPRTSLMIARAERDGGELLAAHDAYRTALLEAEEAARRDPALESTARDIKKEMKDLDGVLGWLTIELVHAPTGTTVTIDGRAVRPEELKAPILVAPGPVTVEASAPNGDEKSRQIAVNAGDRASVKLAFSGERAPAAFFHDGDDESGSKANASSSAGKNTLAFVAIGIGAAGLTAFGVFGALSNSKFNDLEEACPDKHCPPERQGDIDDGKRFQTLANIGLAVGVVGVGTGVALFVFGGPSKQGAEPKASLPRLSVGARSIELRGSF